MRTGWHRVATASVALVLVCVPPALAEPTLEDDTLILEWQAPSQCPDRQAVMERVRALLASSTSRERLSARGTVTAQDSRSPWMLTLETMQSQTTWRRSFEAESCEELADAGALVLALAIDPTITTAAERPADSTTPPPPKQPASEHGEVASKPAKALTVSPIQARAAVSATQHERATGLEERSTSVDLGWAIAGRGIVDWGTLPRAALGVEAGAGVVLGRVELEVLVIYLPEARAIAADSPARGGDVALEALGARACYTWTWDRLGARGCAGGEAGRIRAEGVGADWTRQQTAGWLGARLSSGARARVAGPWIAELGAEAIIPAYRPEFVLDGLGRVHRPAAVSARVVAGVALHF